MDALGLVLVGLAIVVGLVGVVVPVLPGLLLSWAAVLVWALFERTAVAWVVLALATGVVVLSQVLKYLIPGRQMKAAGVPTRSLIVGTLAAVVMFFVIPVVGMFIGFVLGVFVAERIRLGETDRAWTSSMHALKAVGLSILIELAAGLLVAAGWLAAVVFA